MKAHRTIPTKEIIKTAVILLLAAMVVGAVLFAAECAQCVYHEKEVYPSPDGEHRITIRISSPDSYTMELYRIKITAANDGWLIDTVSVSRDFRGVEEWSVEWVGRDTARLTLTGVRDTAVTVDFSGGAPEFAEG